VSSVTLTFPINKLAKLLRQPGGKSVASALRDAEQNVVRLAPSCLAEIDAVLAAVDQLVIEIPPEEEAATFKRVYDQTNAIIGLATAAGLPDFDSAAYSLCDVLDRMLRTGRMDRAVVTVHVRSMQLLRHPDALGSKASVREVLLGLKQVRKKVIARTSSGPDRAR